MSVHSALMKAVATAIPLGDVFSRFSPLALLSVKHRRSFLELSSVADRCSMKVLVRARPRTEGGIVPRILVPSGVGFSES
jgi:hypothetical protein